MKLLKTLLLVAVGARAFGPHGDTTTTWTGEGWCDSELDENIGDFEAVELCYAQCLYIYGDDLVAIDWYKDVKDCYCQDACVCMENVGGDPYRITVTRDSAVDALPGPCGDRRKLKSRKSHK